MKCSMRRGILPVVLSALVVAIASGVAVRARAAQQPITVTFTSFDYPGAKATFGTAINNVGVIAGYYTDTSSILHGFTDSTGTFTSLTFTGSKDTEAWGINDSGEVVGFYSIGTPLGFHGFSYTAGGGFVTIDYPGAVWTYAYGINNSGQIVGTWLDSNEDYHGFTLVSGVYTSFDYPGADWTIAAGVNNDGEISGSYSDNSGSTDTGFTLTGGIGGTYAQVSYPAAYITVPYKINDKGQLVGYFTNTKGQPFGFGNAGSHYVKIDYPGHTTEAAGINNSTNVVGGYTDNSPLITHGFLAVPSE